MEENAVVDCNGNELTVGDSIVVTQNLKPKWAKDIKKGTVVKNIRLVDDDVELIEGCVDGVMMYLKTCFVKKHVKKK